MDWSAKTVNRGFAHGTNNGGGLTTQVEQSATFLAFIPTRGPTRA
ncbi:MAG TPA: hypothetical protein VIY53_06975 [Acidobacteriaceae bacterium]